MSKQSIKATIDANIKQNGNQEITGQIMNSVLNQMVDNLAEEASTSDEFKELRKEILGETNVNINESNVVLHKYITTSGGEGGWNPGFYSKPVAIRAGEKVRYTGVGQGCIAISTSDSIPTFPVTPMVTSPNDTIERTYEYTATQDGFIVISGLWSGFKSLSIISSDSMAGDISALQTNVGNITSDLPRYMHSFNQVVTSANYATLLPDLNNAEKDSIIVVASGLANIANAPQGLTAGTIITMNPVMNNTAGIIQLCIPSGGNIIYFRNHWASWNPWQEVPRASVVGGLAENLKNALTNIGRLQLQVASMGSMFAKVLFIGDSLTQGAYYGTPYISKIGRNFPNMFCRRGNIGGNNEGYSGINPKDWYNTKKKTSYADWDLVILWLGTNDGLTDTLDADVNAHSDYNDYADTNTGCYCKIIEDIYHTNPRANIVMLNCYASSGNITTTRKVLGQIAAKYDLPLYETEWLSLDNDPTYSFHAGVANVHLGIFGAFTLANRLWEFIIDYFSTHWSRLENGIQAEINPTSWTYINR